MKRSIRRRRQAGQITDAERRKRKRIGKSITRFLKEQARTTATQSQAPAIIANLQSQLVAEQQRVA